ncbi:hypothetical protein SK128_011894, partial [Halocaridina rubra]
MAAPCQNCQQEGNLTLSSNYEMLCELKASGTVPVRKYRSKRTGMRIVIGNVEGPMVNGFLTLATEAHDDDGLPHTLEHLVFLGSEDYPFKGVLDLLASRCLAYGTNAWTDTDHTAYTVRTAGSEGFLNLLPIYLDHLLYPTLTESAFITEVYHITGEGEDAGVVYSEMQARENSEYDRCYLAMLRAMFPEPSGFRSETGGIMKNLRESTNIDKIRKYHSEFYRPENINIIVTGQVEPEQVFAALESVEQKILSKGERSPYSRPWESPVPPLEMDIDELVVYPSDVEDTALVIVAWRGPSAVMDFNEVTSMDVLLEYLTYSSVSPLPSIFVEVDDPLASYVLYGWYEFNESVFYFEFSGVPRAKVDLVKPLLMDTLNQLVSGKAQIDMKIMKDILANLILKQDSRLETSPHDTLADFVIGDILYGYSCEHLDARINKKLWYHRLTHETDEFWLNLIRKYFINRPSVVIRGVPSISEATRLQEEEKYRIEARKVELGEEHLKTWVDRLENAQYNNEIPPPSQMLQSVPVPSVASINFHPSSAYSNHISFDPQVDVSRPQPEFSQLLSNLPVKFQLDDLNSNFVEIVAVLDSSSLLPTLRPYLTLYLDLIFESPISRGEVIVPYEEVVRELTADTLSRDTGIGLGLYRGQFSIGPYSSNVAVILKMEMEKYVRGVQWLREILFSTQFNADRIRVKANKLLNSIGEYKRSGSKILQLMYNDVNFKKDTNLNQLTILRQQKFLTSLLERLVTEENIVLKEIEEVRSTIVHKDRIVIHMATSIEKLATIVDPMAPWTNFMTGADTPKDKLLNIIPDSQLLSQENLGNVTGFLTGVGSVESSYLLQTTYCVTEHRDWDVPAILTAIQYLTQLEGPMWRGIRGKGLAYEYAMTLLPTEGTITLKLARAAQLTDAYIEALNIINNHINGSTSWDDDLLESARSSLIYEVIDREAVVADVVQQSLLAYFRRVPHTYN